MEKDAADFADKLPSITPKEQHNYVAFFLTLACNLHCDYCLNLHQNAKRSHQQSRKMLTGGEWVAAANRLVLRDDLPLTLQGGEPTLHQGFYQLVNEVNEEIKMDLMTNMMFNVDEFINNVPVWRFTRNAPYAAIRVSYHPGQNHIDDLIDKTMKMQDAGFRIGIYGIEHPDSEIQKHILEVQEKCLKLDIDFRMKEFLGEHQGRLYGTFKFPGCVGGKTTKSCDCKTSEIIVDPSGQIYRCHSDLYNGRQPITHILDDGFSEESIESFRPCNHFGCCNPCDVKVKTNRFQVFGHTSVEIQDIRESHVLHSQKAPNNP